MSVSSVNNSTDRNYLDLIGSDSSKSTEKAESKFDAIFENDKDTSIKFDDFFNLMLMQLSNQDFMNPVDDTQYLSQLAQIGSMEAMQEIAQYEKSNYAMSYLGKVVTVSKNNIGGTVTQETGTVTQISLLDDEFKLTINGNTYSLKEVKEIHSSETENNSNINDDFYDMGVEMLNNGVEI